MVVAVVVAYYLLYFLCRFFWTRTFISIGFAIAAAVSFFQNAETGTIWKTLAFYFVSFFFFFGIVYGAKTGEEDVSYEFHRKSIKETKTAFTFTGFIIAVSAVLAFVSCYLSKLHTIAAIVIPCLLVIIKIICIILHVRSGRSSFTSYGDDSDPDSVTTYW